MRIRFQADADLDGRILRGLRRIAPELNMRAAAEAGLAAVEDSEVLRLAAEAGRILISQDRSTMPGHFQRLGFELPESRRNPPTRQSTYRSGDRRTLSHLGG